MSQKDNVPSLVGRLLEALEQNGYRIDWCNQQNKSIVKQD